MILKGGTRRGLQPETMRVPVRLPDSTFARLPAGT